MLCSFRRHRCLTRWLELWRGFVVEVSVTWISLSPVGDERERRCCGGICFSSNLSRRSSAEADLPEPCVDWALCRAPLSFLDRLVWGSESSCLSPRAAALFEDWLCLQNSAPGLRSWRACGWNSGGVPVGALNDRTKKKRGEKVVITTLSQTKIKAQFLKVP